MNLDPNEPGIGLIERARRMPSFEIEYNPRSFGLKELYELMGLKYIPPNPRRIPRQKPLQLGVQRYDLIPSRKNDWLYTHPENRDRSIGLWWAICHHTTVECRTRHKTHLLFRRLLKLNSRTIKRPV